MSANARISGDNGPFLDKSSQDFCSNGFGAQLLNFTMRCSIFEWSKKKNGLALTIVRLINIYRQLVQALWTIFSYDLDTVNVRPLTRDTHDKGSTCRQKGKEVCADDGQEHLFGIMK